METYNFPRIVPQLVEDNSLKRARTTITEGGEEKEAIRVTSVGGNGGLDSQGVADAMALVPESVPVTGSVLKNLELMEACTDAIARDTLRIKSDVSSMEHTLNNDIIDVLGTQSDSLVTLQDGSISARLRGLTSLTSTINSNTSNIKSYANSIDTFSSRISGATGTQSDAAWSGTGDGTVIALLKGIYNKL